MRTRRIAGITALVILVSAILFVNKTYATVSDTVLDAQKACPSTVWAIERDSPFFNIYQVDYNNAAQIKAFQETSKGDVSSFACSQSKANDIVRFERALEFSMYIVFLPVWLPLVLLTVAAWWVYGEFRNFQKPKKNTKKRK